MPRLWTGSAWDALLVAHSIWTTHLHSGCPLPRPTAQVWSCRPSKKPNITSGLQVPLPSRSPQGSGLGKTCTDESQCSPGVPCGWAQGLALQSLSECTRPTKEDPLLFLYHLQLLPLSSGPLAPTKVSVGAGCPRWSPVMGLHRSSYLPCNSRCLWPEPPVQIQMPFEGGVGRPSRWSSA